MSVAPDSMMAKFLSRNYHLTLLVVLASVAALFMGKMTGTEFASITGGALTQFRAGDVFMNWLQLKAKP